MHAPRQLAAPGREPAPGPVASAVPDPPRNPVDAPDADDVAALRARLVVGRSGRPSRPRPADHLDPGEPAARGHVAWAVTVRSVVVGVVVVAVVAAALAVRALGSRPGEVVLLAPTASTAGSDGVAPQPAGTGTGALAPGAAGQGPADADLRVVVHVVGRVVRPGVVTLPPGARVIDAVEAAGGLRRDADVTHVNLARHVADGEQVVVPRRGEEPPPAPTSGTAASGAGTLVDLNGADAAALDALPGIGPVLAQRIVDHRAEHGPFPDVASLTDVPGIGPALSARLGRLVSVG